MEFWEQVKDWSSVGVLAGAALYGFIKGIYNKLFKKHPTIDTDVKFSAPIYDILTEILFQLPATRAFIKQFHNGSQYYSGQKIQRLSVSHEKCRPDVHPLKMYHDNVQVPTEIHDMVSTMDEDRKDWFWTADHPDLHEKFPELDVWQKTYGSKATLYVRLFDRKTGDTLGLLGITFNHMFRLDKEADILYLMRKKKEIEGEFKKI